MTEQRYLRAYYHEFVPTGVDHIDAILEAIALAGKAYHSTEAWDEAEEYGPCGYWSLIQQRANEAATHVQAETNAEEPVAWGEEIDGKIVSVRLDKSRHCTVPLYPAPQPSGKVEVKGRKALVEKYASAVKRLGREIVGMPECVIRQHFDEFLDEALSALTAGKPEQAVPSGWKLVPEEPTHEMVRACLPMYDAFIPDSEWPFTINLYRKMLSVAPAAPTAGGGDE